MLQVQQELRAVEDPISLRKEKQKSERLPLESNSWERLALKAASKHATQSTLNEKIRTRTADIVDALADILACFTPDQATYRAEKVVRLTETLYIQADRERPARHVGIFPEESLQVQHNLTRFNQAQFAVEVAYETARRAGWTRPTTTYKRVKTAVPWKYGTPRPEEFPTQTECTLCNEVTHGWPACRLWKNAREQLGWRMSSKAEKKKSYRKASNQRSYQRAKQEKRLAKNNQVKSVNLHSSC